MERRSHLASTWLTPVEYDAVIRAADALDLSLAAFLRRSATAASATIIKQLTRQNATHRIAVAVQQHVVNTYLEDATHG